MFELPSHNKQGKPARLANKTRRPEEKLIVDAVLANCHTCLCGNRLSSRFGVPPPDLNSYLYDPIVDLPS